MDQPEPQRDGQPPGGGRRLVHRRRAVICAAIGAALVSVGGLVGSTYVQSPAQAAADTRAPQASVITAPVTSQVLRSTLVLRGTFSDGKTMAATPTVVAATANNPGGGTAVITQLFTKPGEQVKAGVPMVEYSGRPVFALAGSIPMYRDLAPGESGHDIAQLQDALNSMGYGTGSDKSGVFGSGTKHAVSELYAAMGYSVPVTGATTANAVKSAQQVVDQARAALKGAEDRSAAATANGSPTVVLPGSTPSSAPGGPTSGPGSDLDDLRKQLAQAEDALAQAQAADGPMLPASECVFVPSLPARVVTVPLGVGDAVKGPVVTLARGEMQLTGMLDPSQGGLVKPGMPVQITAEAQGLQATGTVDSVGALVAPGSNADSAAAGQSTPQQAPLANGGAAYLPLTIKPDHAWDGPWSGQNVRITITSATTADAVLAVPEAAIFAGSNTRTSVTAIAANGSQRTVNVQVGPSADGLVQVTPVDGGRLAVGDRVVIGQ